MSKITLTNMVMIQNKDTGEVIVQDRIISWKGLSFPGGHIEDGESIVDSAVREVQEETGLTPQNLKFCGVVHWLNDKTFERYFVFLFKTADYTGNLISECNEGRNFWIPLEEFKNTSSENQMAEKYLPMFLEDKYNEAFGLWNSDGERKIIYK